MSDPTSSDCVEVVARAIHGADAQMAGGIERLAGNPTRWPWENQGERREAYRKRARSAILAMDSEIERLSGIIERRNATYTKPNEGFVCFHCGERFLTYESAKEHFGEGPDSLRAENAALKQRLIIDDAMVERAERG